MGLLSDSSTSVSNNNLVTLDNSKIVQEVNLVTITKNLKITGSASFLAGDYIFDYVPIE